MCVYVCVCVLLYTCSCIDYDSIKLYTVTVVYCNTIENTSTKRVYPYRGYIV